MSGPAVVFQRLDGALVTVRPGGILGRLPGAALRLSGPAISEVHAYVSLRGAALRLLALRCPVHVDGHAVEDVELEPGQVVALSPEVVLQVDDVVLPPEVLTVLDLGPDPVVVPGPEASLVLAPALELVEGHAPDAQAWLWEEDDGWRVQRRDAAPLAVARGMRLSFDGRNVVLDLRPLGRLHNVTRRPSRPGLRITLARHETDVAGPHGERLRLTGRLHDLVRELRLYDEPTHWEEIALEIWGEDAALREGFKRLTRRLRNKLQQAGLRDDLVTSDGDGRWRLLLAPEDVVDDAGLWRPG